MFLFVLACTAARDPEPRSDERPSDTSGDASAPLPCPEFGPPVALGTAEPTQLREASGLVVVEGTLWTHNDSGHRPGVFGLDRTGAEHIAARVADVTAADVEDIAHLGGDLLLGDIGDNLGVRDHIGLLALPVPDGAAEEVPARSIVLAWDVGPRNAETLLADPVSGDVLVVSKEADGNSHVGRVATPLPDVGLLETVALLPFASGLLPGEPLATGGDVAPDGAGVVIRTYAEAFVWPRIPGEPWVDTFVRPACRIALEEEPKGEAIAWAEDGLYTISEGLSPTIWFYPALPPAR